MDAVYLRCLACGHTGMRVYVLLDGSKVINASCDSCGHDLPKMEQIEAALIHMQKTENAR